MKYLYERGQMNENKMRLDPLPPGPYYYVSQFDESAFIENHHKVTYEIKFEFTYDLGKVVFVFDKNWNMTKVGANYDSSD